MTTGSGQLERIHRELDDVDARAAALAQACSVDRWQARPPSGGWSPSECLQHLELSADAMLPRIDAAIDEGRRRQALGDGPYRPRLFARLLMWVLEPPYRMRSKTGAAFVPAVTRTPEEDVAALRAAHDRVRASLGRARGLALDRLTLASPFFERARYDVYGAFAIIAVHARRHVWQAEQTARRSSAA